MMYTALVENVYSKFALYTFEYNKFALLYLLCLYLSGAYGTP